MAHFVQLNEQNIVIRAIVVANEVLLEDGIESEAKGISFCKELLGGDRWIQTSYNSTFRKNYAREGATYDPQNDAFIPPKPYASWVLNNETFRWDPPIPMPVDGKYYNWDEDIKNWLQWNEATQSWVEYLN